MIVTITVRRPAIAPVVKVEIITAIRSVAIVMVGIVRQIVPSQQFRDLVRHDKVLPTHDGQQDDINHILRVHGVLIQDGRGRKVKIIMFETEKTPRLTQDQPKAPESPFMIPRSARESVANLTQKTDLQEVCRMEFSVAVHPNLLRPSPTLA